MRGDKPSKMFYNQVLEKNNGDELNRTRACLVLMMMIENCKKILLKCRKNSK